MKRIDTLGMALSAVMCVCGSCASQDAEPAVKRALLQQAWTEVAKAAIDWKDLDPTAIVPDWLLGYAALETGDYPLATKCFSSLAGKKSSQPLSAWSDALVRKNPKSAIAQMLRGDALARQGKYAQALLSLNEAVRLDPACPLIYNVRGIVRALADRPETAAADFEKSISLAPTFVDPLVNLGLLRLVEGDLVGARLHLDDAIATGSNHPLAHNARGALHAQLRSWSASETDFGRARVAAPETTFLRGNLQLASWTRANEQARSLRQADTPGPDATAAPVQAFERYVVDVGDRRSVDVFTIGDTAQTGTLEGMEATLGKITETLRSELGFRGNSGWKPKILVVQPGLGSNAFAERQNLARMALYSGKDFVVSLDWGQKPKFPLRLDDLRTAPIHQSLSRHFERMVVAINRLCGTPPDAILESHSARFLLRNQTGSMTLADLHAQGTLHREFRLGRVTVVGMPLTGQQVDSAFQRRCLGDVLAITTGNLSSSGPDIRFVASKPLIGAKSLQVSQYDRTAPPHRLLFANRWQGSQVNPIPELVASYMRGVDVASIQAYADRLRVSVPVVTSGTTEQMATQFATVRGGLIPHKVDADGRTSVLLRADGMSRWEPVPGHVARDQLAPWYDHRQQVLRNQVAIANALREQLGSEGVERLWQGLATATTPKPTGAAAGPPATGPAPSPSSDACDGRLRGDEWAEANARSVLDVLEQGLRTPIVSYYSLTPAEKRDVERRFVENRQKGDDKNVALLGALAMVTVHRNLKETPWRAMRENWYVDRAERAYARGQNALGAFWAAVGAVEYAVFQIGLGSQCRAAAGMMASSSNDSERVWGAAGMAWSIVGGELSKAGAGKTLTLAEQRLKDPRAKEVLAAARSLLNAIKQADDAHPFIGPTGPLGPMNSIPAGIRSVTEGGGESRRSTTPEELALVADKLERTLLPTVRVVVGYLERADEMTVVAALGLREDDLSTTWHSSGIVEKRFGKTRWSTIRDVGDEKAVLVYDAAEESPQETVKNVLDVVAKIRKLTGDGDTKVTVVLVGDPESAEYKALKKAFEDAGVTVVDAKNLGEGYEKAKENDAQTIVKVGGRKKRDETPGSTAGDDGSVVPTPIDSDRNRRPYFFPPPPPPPPVVFLADEGFLMGPPDDDDHHDGGPPPPGGGGARSNDDGGPPPPGGGAGKRKGRDDPPPPGGGSKDNKRYEDNSGSNRRSDDDNPPPSRPGDEKRKPNRVYTDRFGRIVEEYSDHQWVFKKDARGRIVSFKIRILVNRKWRDLDLLDDVYYEVLRLLQAGANVQIVVVSQGHGQIIYIYVNGELRWIITVGPGGKIIDIKRGGVRVRADVRMSHYGEKADTSDWFAFDKDTSAESSELLFESTSSPRADQSAPEGVAFFCPFTLFSAVRETEP
jgi:Flp pilus assembly protein TadD